MPDDIKSSHAQEPPETLSREDLVEGSEAVLARPGICFQETEHVFTFNELGHDLDVGVLPIVS